MSTQPPPYLQPDYQNIPMPINGLPPQLQPTQQPLPTQQHYQSKAPQQLPPAIAQQQAAYHNVPLKRTRSTRACDTCRRKRTKCTGGQPCEGCIAFGLSCAYTAPQKKRGPPKRSETQKSQTTLGERLKTVECLLSGLINGAPEEMPVAKRARSISQSSAHADHRRSISNVSFHSDEDEDGEEDEDDLELNNCSGGFKGIALAVHRPRGRQVAVARATSLEDDRAASAPTFCQVPWRAGVTVTDPKSGVLVQSLSLNDDSVIAHRFNNSAGDITIVEDVVTDTVLFYGSTSTSNTSALRQSPRFNDGVMSIALRSDVVPANPTLPIDSPPCSPDLVHHLVSLYFTHIHPYLPMIDRVAFTKQLKEKQTEHFSLLLNSMCALVTQQTRSLSAWGISSSAELHRAFFERARALLGKQFDWPHINNVQALLLLTLVGAGTNTNASSYQYIGVAHRHAVELGMHRNLEKLKHPGLDTAMKEQMRATWFCLYILDRYTGVHQGRLFAINDDDWDTPLPRQEETGDVARMIRHVALCSILGKIANYVNRPAQRRRRSRATRDQLVRDVDGELAHWHSLLPEDLKREPMQAAGSWSFHHHLHVMYHTAVILLHRLATGQFTGVCGASALAIRQTLEALPLSSGANANSSDYVFVMPIVVYSGLTASTLFLDMALEKRLGNGKQIPRRKRSRTEDSLNSEIGLEGGLNAEEELKRSLTVFDKLKDTSMFSVYYGQLIAECMKGNFKAADGEKKRDGPLRAEAAKAADVVEEKGSQRRSEAHVNTSAMGPGPSAPAPHPTSIYNGAMNIPITTSPLGTHSESPGMGLLDQFNMNGCPTYPTGNTIPTSAAGGFMAPGNGPAGPSQPGYYADSIFTELLNPFFDPSIGWWNSMGLHDPENGTGLGGDSPPANGDGMSAAGSSAEYYAATPTSGHPSDAGQYGMPNSSGLNGYV